MARAGRTTSHAGAMGSLTVTLVSGVAPAFETVMLNTIDWPWRTEPEPATLSMVTPGTSTLTEPVSVLPTVPPDGSEAVTEAVFTKSAGTTGIVQV